MTSPAPSLLDEAAAKARFLARLAAEGIVLPPDQAGAAATDALVLARQIRLIRAALDPEAPLPLSFTLLDGGE